MLRWRKRIRKITYLLTDLICFVLAFVLSVSFYTNTRNTTLSLSAFERLSFLMLFMLFLVMLYLVLNVYDHTIEEFGRISTNTGIKMIVSLVMTEVFIGALLFYVQVNLSRLFLIDFTVLIILTTVLNRILLKQFNFGNQNSDKNKKNILVVGHSNRGIAYIEEIKKHDYLNLNIVGYVCIQQCQAYEGIESLGCLDDLLQVVTDYVIDEIAVARPLSYDDRLPDLLETCQNMGITVTMLLETQNKNSKAQVAMIGNLPVLKFHTVSLNESQLFAKRVIDVLGATVGMIIFGIAFLIVGPLIVLETPGPVIFKQDRVGKNGRIFKVWKFRSMGVNAEAEKAALMCNNEMTGHMFKMTNDPRVTKIGAFIRKTSIDELPQFYNVLKGDMSLVGTRPPTVNEVKEYENHHRRRISIMPGITGNWQVSGRSEIENFEEVLRLDEEYIKDWSVMSDIKILFKTVAVVLKREGSK